MIVYILTDMEGIAGIDDWDQCHAHDPDNGSPRYQYGRAQLTADVNAAIAGCFDAGATDVRVLDGHGYNFDRGFLPDVFDPRGRQVGKASTNPIRWEGLDRNVSAVAVVGQHAMAGTLNGFLDHTQEPKKVCRYRINGQAHGELSMFACYAGYYDVPVVYASGDEALCAEAKRLFPWITTTPTKRGTGWQSCELYPPQKVREQIRKDLAGALQRRSECIPWKPSLPLRVELEWSWSGGADNCSVPGVIRVDARTVQWTITDPQDICTWPSSSWTPALAHQDPQSHGP